MGVRADLIPSADTLQCNQDLIFATETGKLLDAPNINRRTFKPLLLPVGLHPIRFHDPPHCSLREEITQDRLRNSWATAKQASPSTPTLTSSSTCRTMSPEPSRTP